MKDLSNCIDGTYMFDKHKLKEGIFDVNNITIKMIDKDVTLVVG